MSVTEAKLKAESGIARERPVKLADRAGLRASLKRSSPSGR